MVLSMIECGQSCTCLFFEIKAPAKDISTAQSDLFYVADNHPVLPCAEKVIFT